jgi:transcriptional regulator with XRE-family HTH domain
MRLKTRIFELNHYKNLSELAQAMGISISQIYRVQEGKRSINEKFIVGAMRAFPRHSIDDLFYLAPTPPMSPDHRATSEKQELESMERVLERLDLAGDVYDKHTRSHISATLSLNKASQELENGTKELNKVLSRIIREPVNNAEDKLLTSPRTAEEPKKRYSKPAPFRL